MVLDVGGDGFEAQTVIVPLAKLTLDTKGEQLVITVNAAQITVLTWAPRTCKLVQDA